MFPVASREIPRFQTPQTTFLSPELIPYRTIVSYIRPCINPPPPSLVCVSKGIRKLDIPIQPP